MLRRMLLTATVLSMLLPGLALAKSVSKDVRLGGLTADEDVTKVLQSVRGVQGVLSASATKSTLSVVYDDKTITITEVRNAVQRAGFSADGWGPDGGNLGRKQR